MSSSNEFYFRGTTEDLIASMQNDFSRASESGRGGDGYFNRALASLVGLVDRQAELGPIEPRRLKIIREQVYEKLLSLGDKLSVYVPKAVTLVESRPDLWYEICIRRSAIQLLLDDYPGTPLTALIEPADIVELDTEMRQVGAGEGPVPEDKIPKGLPLNHWWWTYPNQPKPPVDDLKTLNPQSGEAVRVDDLDARGLNLQRFNFRGARLATCHLQNANIEDADFRGATVRLCAFDVVRASGACFDDARLENSTAEAADFSRATFRRGHLTETTFSRAILRGAVLDGAEGDGVEFRGADMRGATMIGARLDEADFRGADLRGADLSNGRFHSADFRGALLDGTAFEGADCKYATFDSGSVPGSGSDELARKLEEFTEKLGHDEPPEEWRTWLEPLMNITQGKPSIEQIISAVGQINPDDVKVWLDSIAEKQDEPGQAESPS